MQIRAISSIEEQPFKIYIIKDSSELGQLSLSDDERKYAEDTLEKGSVAVVNRYHEQLFLVKVSEQKEAFRQKEELRKVAVNLVKMVNRKKAGAVGIEAVDETMDLTGLAEGMALSNYQFLKYFSDGSDRTNTLHTLYIKNFSKEDIRHTEAKMDGAFLARNLVNEPLSYLTAEKLAQQAVNAGERYNFDVSVLDKAAIEKLKMGGLLAVNRGSVDPPAFIIMEHKPENPVNDKPLVLVGKGVVYDTGGLSLKPTPNSMDTMKSDMGGAAGVIGAMASVSAAKLPVHVIALVPATDNRPGGNAYAPGDVIKMFDGSTVEVLNTDAEGRMIMADALAYAKNYDPELVVDMATLTGSAAVAIGKQGVVAMGNASEQIFEQLRCAGEESYERIAQLPFWDEYNDLLKSSIADVKNVGGREAGAITAGKFLERFTDYPYVHLDIAGPAFLAADDHYRLQGGTGVGVRLLYEFIKSRV